MNDFTYDCMQKKRLASQARHKKCGSKSRYCGLPSDHLTPKQWKERNGKVMSFSMSAPMDWATFKTLPKDLKQEYVGGLVERFGVNGSSLAKMFGVTPQTFRLMNKNEDLGFHFSVGGSMSQDRREAWEKFLSCQPEIAIAPAPVETVDPELSEVEALTPAEKMKMTHVELSFSGELDLNEILNSLRYIVGTNTVGTINISCDFK